MLIEWCNKSCLQRNGESDIVFCFWSLLLENDLSSPTDEANKNHRIDRHIFGQKKMAIKYYVRIPPQYKPRRPKYQQKHRSTWLASPKRTDPNTRRTYSHCDSFINGQKWFVLVGLNDHTIWLIKYLQQARYCLSISKARFYLDRSVSFYLAVILSALRASKVARKKIWRYWNCNSPALAAKVQWYSLTVFICMRRSFDFGRYEQSWIRNSRKYRE